MKTTSAALSFLVLSLYAGFPAHAQLTTTCVVDTRFRLGNQTTQVGTVTNNGLSCSSPLNQAGIGVATANAVVGYGFVKADTHADTLSQPPTGNPQSANAQALVGWLDRFVINAPGLGNQMGVMTFSVTLSGFMSSSVPGLEDANRGWWSFAAGLSPSYFNNPDGGVLLSMDPTRSFNNPVPLRGTFQQGWNITVTGRSAFRFNEEVALKMDLQLRTDATALGGTVDGFFGNSAYWGGIQSITTASGTVLNLASGPAQAGQYSMVTQSGFDWHPSQVPSPVPEPPAAWLMLLGLPLLRRLLPSTHR